MLHPGHSGRRRKIVPSGYTLSARCTLKATNDKRTWLCFDYYNEKKK
jgi:hypothetical protein